MIVSELSETQRRVFIAEFAKVAYRNKDEAFQFGKRKGLGKVDFFDKEGAQAYLFSNNTDVIITCRGTQASEMSDIFADLEVFKSDSVTGTKIHQGFKEEVDKIYDKVEEKVEDVEKLKVDANSAKITSQIDEEIKQMRTSGIPRLSVPKFLINGKEPQGGRNIENYSAIIDAELKKK